MIDGYTTTTLYKAFTVHNCALKKALLAALAG